MSAVRLLTLLLLLPGCVTGHFSRRGELVSTTELTREVTDRPRGAIVTGRVAAVQFTRTSCATVKRVYLTENYKTQSWPGGAVALLGTLATGGLLTLAISSGHEGFLWPEGMPSIQYVSWFSTVVVGAFTVIAGWMSWGQKTSFDKDVLLGTSLTGQHDTVERECEDEDSRRAGPLPWQVDGEGGVLSGDTPISGELDLGGPAKALVTQGPIGEARYRALSSQRIVKLSVQLGDAPTVGAEVALQCLNRDPAPQLLACKLRCADKDGVERCQRRVDRCAGSFGVGSPTCTQMMESCLADKVADRSAFEVCQAGCLKQALVEACR